MTTFPVQDAARTSDGCMYVIRPAFLNPLGVPSQLLIRQIAEALLGSLEDGIARVFRVVVEPAETLTEPVWTASSPLKTVRVYVPGSAPGIEKYPSEERAEPQYCAAELASPTVYA